MPDSAQPIPLMPGFRPGRALVRRLGQTLTHEALLSQAAGLARAMPPAPCVFNLCEDRGLFVLSLCAALVRGVPCLLPPSRVVETIEGIGAAYPGALCLCDGPVEGLALPQWVVAPPFNLPADPPPMPAIAADLDSILAFTSGSTGRPQAHPKRWGDLMVGAMAAARRFAIGPEVTLVATVPPQHMYGLELSVLLPLAVGAALEAGRPFFPEDVRRALARVPPPRVLVTTPVHLAACVDAMAAGWPEVELVISATAPLSEELAGLVEQRLATRVCEIYGCTEAGSIASRRTLAGPRWRWYDGVTPCAQGDRVAIRAGFLPTTVPLTDTLDLHGDGTFRLIGRSSDLVKIAGKRASLADLNIRLNGIAGVRDGVFVAPAEAGRGVPRLAAVAVAPGLDRETLLRALRRLIDPVFLPRPLVLVDRLPRNETGKIPREGLLKLVQGRDPERP